jgi:hypothetical protein
VGAPGGLRQLLVQCGAVRGSVLLGTGVPKAIGYDRIQLVPVWQPQAASSFQ